MNNTPNPFPSYIGSIARSLGGVVAGYVIAKGYFTAEQTAQIGGGLAAAAIAGWSLYQKWRAHKMLKAA